ncbi:MAG: hypothetical protein ACYS99_14795 [Planctomycetota bacterium]|jgi:hypothetical protein
MRRTLVAVPLALIAILLCADAAQARDAGVRVEVVLESDEVNAGDTLRAAAVVKNVGKEDQFVIVTGFLAPVREPIRIPPFSRWERFVYELLAKISGDCEVIYVPAGETRATTLEIEVHPRVHGRFDVVALAKTKRGRTAARASVISKITAPPSGGGVLVHGMVYEVGACRVLVTDDGHIYEPKGADANLMFRLLDYISPRPDGVTVLGGILPNTIGCFGVELEVDFFRFDREPGEPVGVRYRHLSRGRSPEEYAGPDEEVVKSAARFAEVVDALDAVIVGRRPNFKREMVAVVTTAGTSLTNVRVRRIVEKDGELRIHYVVTNPGPGCLLPAVFAQPYHIVALPKFGGPVRFVRHDLSIRCDAVKTGVLDVAESLDLLQADTIGRASAIGRSLTKDEKARRKITDSAGR